MISTMKKIILVIVLFIVSQLVGSVIGSAAIILPQLITDGQIDTSKVMELYSENLGSITILSLIISQILLIIVFRAMKLFGIMDLTTKIQLKILVVIVLFILSSLFALDLINSLLKLPDNNEWLFKEMSGSVYIIIPIAFLGPIVEEIVFRKVIVQEFLNMSLKPYMAILLSALLFGLIHMNPAQMVFAFAAGLIFGWIYLKTGSILPGIIGHIINNTIGIIELRSSENFQIVDQASHFLTQPLFLTAFIGSLILSLSMVAYINRYYK